MNFKRGILAGLLWAAIGFTGPILVVCTYLKLYSLFGDPDRITRYQEYSWWRARAVPPLVVIPLYLGFAAWSTYAPKRYFGFAKTLAVLTVASLFLTNLLFGLGLTPQRLRGIDHPDLYFSEFILLILPPVLVARYLVRVRCNSSSAQVKESQQTSEEKLWNLHSLPLSQESSQESK